MPGICSSGHWPRFPHLQRLTGGSSTSCVVQLPTGGMEEKRVWGWTGQKKRERMWTEGTEGSVRTERDGGKKGDDGGKRGKGRDIRKSGITNFIQLYMSYSYLH